MFINSSNVTDFLLQISRGKIDGFSRIHKFGRSANVTTVESVICDLGGKPLKPTSAITMTIASSSVNDDAGGTGARNVFIYGLDDNFDEISEEITLDGTTGVNTTNQYRRVTRMFVDGVGSLGFNDGNITVSNGGNDYMQILAGNGQTLQSQTTVPSGKKGYIVFGKASTGKGKAVEASFYIRLANGKSWRKIHTFEVYESSYDYPFFIPVEISGEADIEVRATTDSGTVSFSCAYDIILESE